VFHIDGGDQPRGPYERTRSGDGRWARFPIAFAGPEQSGTMALPNMSQSLHMVTGMGLTELRYQGIIFDDPLRRIPRQKGLREWFGLFEGLPT